MWLVRVFVVALASIVCPVVAIAVDSDGDGYDSTVDCNDSNFNIHPGATEVCDGVDNDCDLAIDEGVRWTFYSDADGDGYGNPSVTTQACSAPAGYVSNGDDCNDANSRCRSDCTDADSDNYCVTTDCNDHNALCTTNCSACGTATNTPTATPTQTDAPTATPTDTKTATPASTATDTSTSTATNTPTDTATSTAAPTDTDTVADTATSVATPTPSPSPTGTIVLSGSLLYYAGSHPPVGGVSVVGSTTVGGSPLVTLQSDLSGNYVMTSIVSGPWVVEPGRTEPTPWPRASLARGLSSVDSAWIQQYLVSARAFSANQILAADTTGNGSISSLDASRIQEWRVLLRERMPVAEICGLDWAFVPMPGPQGNPTPVTPAAAPTPCVRGAITYASLDSSVSGQDFEAVLYGDVTGNWTPAGGGSTDMDALAGGGSAESDALDSAAVSLPAPPCDGPCAAVSADRAIAVNLLDAVQAFDLHAVLPPGVEVLAVKKAELPVAANDCSLAWSAKEGLLRISLACVTPIHGGGALLSVETQGSKAEIELSKCIFDETEIRCAGRQD